MIDLDAPIVPGKSAAGVFIGSVVNELFARVDHSTTKLSSGERHDLGTVKVWAEDGVITQIGVYSGYRGVLQPGIRVGSTISDVEEFRLFCPRRRRRQSRCADLAGLVF